MRTYIITYTYPLIYQGTYVVKGVDGFDASKKLQKYLKEHYGGTNDSHSMVYEIYDNKLIFV